MDIDECKIDCHSRLTGIEYRLKYVEDQLNKVELLQESLAALSNSYSVLSLRMDIVTANIADIKTGVEGLKDVPRSRWEKTVMTIVTTVVGAIIGLLIAHLK